MALNLLCFSSFLIMSFIISWILEKHMGKRWGRKTNPVLVILPVAAAALLILVSGYNFHSLKGFILFLLLIYASESDRQTREVDDYIHIMILLTAMIGTEPAKLPVMAVSAVLIAIPQLIIAALKPNTYGDADIKLSAACTFLLGFQKGLAAIIAGLVTAIAMKLIQNFKKHNIKEPFALVPYLSAGCFFAFLT